MKNVHKHFGGVLALVFVGILGLCVFVMGFRHVNAALESGSLELTILHTNDIHARLSEFNSFGNPCSPEESKQQVCFGGVARQATAIKRIRENEKNVLLLDAGDQFQGTLFYTTFKGAPFAQFMNQLGYNAMTIGNHEFDDGPAELSDFIHALDFPILSVNIDFSREASLKDSVEPYKIMEIEGRKVGILGFTTEESRYISSPGGDIRFKDIVSSVQNAIDCMESHGVNIVIGLSHTGMGRDIEIAAAVDGLDVLIGGHTHTLLSKKIDPELGDYPTVVTSTSGKPVLIVSAGEYGKYLGHLNVSFDEDGVVRRWSGDPLLLDRNIPQDEKILTQVKDLDRRLDYIRQQEVGITKVDLNGDKDDCRFHECNMGNLIADALLWEARAQGAQIAFINGGGIRAKIPRGKITMAQILQVLPFGNSVATLKLKGSDIRRVLEHSVSRADNPLNEGTGRFLQVAGISFAWDSSQPVGSRVVDVKVVSHDGVSRKLDDNEIYSVITADFIRRGGDDYSVLKENAINPYDFGRVASDVLAGYLKEFSPIEIGVDGRITRVN